MSFSLVSLTSAKSGACLLSVLRRLSLFWVDINEFVLRAMSEIFMFWLRVVGVCLFIVVIVSDLGVLIGRV